MSKHEEFYPKIVIITEGGKVVQGFTSNLRFRQIEVLEASGPDYYKRMKEIRETMHPAQVRAWTIADRKESKQPFSFPIPAPPKAGVDYPTGKAKDFFEITPEMVAYLDIYLGREITKATKEVQHIFKLDNNQGYMLLMAWTNDRFRKYGNPTVKNLLPITLLP